MMMMMMMMMMIMMMRVGWGEEWGGGYSFI